MGAATALGVAAAAAVAIHFGAHDLVRMPVGDMLVRAAARFPPAHPGRAPDVAVVELDEQSLKAQDEAGNPWPWSRSRHARALRRLDRAGARAVVFDINFSDASDREGDLAFAHAMRESRSVVLAAYKEERELDGARLEVASPPHPRFVDAAAAVGHVHVRDDWDGLLRRIDYATDIQGEPMAALAEAALAVALREPVVNWPRGQFRIDFRRGGPHLRHGAPDFPVIHFDDLLAGGAAFDPTLVTGRIVLIGGTARRFQDFWDTPVAPARPGVLVQALAVRTLAAQRAGAPVLHVPSKGLEMAFAGLVSLLAALVGTQSHARRLAGLAGLAAGMGVVVFLLLLRSGLLLDAVMPLGVVAVHYALGLEVVRRRFRRRLAQRELSLGALFDVGRATARPGDGDSLELALVLLGDVVDASGVSLFRAGPDGRLDDRRLEWCRDAGGPIGCADTATQTLDDRRVRIFQGERPASRDGGGLAVYTPLFAGEAPVGVLVVERAQDDPLEDVQLKTIATVGTQLALSAQNVRLLQSLRETFQAAVESVASAIEARDGYTELHCRRLAAFSVQMGRRLGLDDEALESIRLGALLHDVGKIGIRDDVLLKPGRLTPAERREMEKHPEIGARIVESIPGMSQLTRDCILHHHEWWDGTGYPRRTVGEAIPLAARIVAVVDVWDALSTARLYKVAYPQQTVRLILRKASGTQFDPELVELFLRILDEEGDEMLALLGAGPDGPGAPG